MTLGIIGTCGRGSDSDHLTRDTLTLMFAVAQSFATLLRADRVVSGGAAWADSVAVSLYLRGLVPSLTLHLPAPFKGDRYEDTDAGRASNRYHIRATSIHGLNGLAEIREAIQRGATVTEETGSGMAPFFTRNAKVAADADAPLAFTYGVRGESALKDGGTAHTMDAFLKRRTKVEAALKATADTHDLNGVIHGGWTRTMHAYHLNLTDTRLHTL